MKKRSSNQILLIVVVGMLVFGSISLTLFPAARVSERENRILAEMPHLSAAELANGSYTAGLDTYAAERFPFRVTLRAARSLLQVGMGRQEVGDVLLCTDGSLCKRISVNERVYQKNLKALQQLQAVYGERMTVAVVPRRIDVRTEVLPPLYDASENTVAWDILHETLPSTVTFPTLTADAHWYRTDHHWSTEGAYQAYVQLGEVLGYAPIGKAEFSIETVSSNFYGTTDAAAGLPFVSPDSIQLYRYADDTAYAVKKDGKPAPFVGFYNMEKLQTRDQYGVFFGGNCGVLEISDNTDRPTLLVIKDSFANAMLPFLAWHYNIVAIDPRYHASIDDFAGAADHVLCLLGMQTLCTAVLFK